MKLGQVIIYAKDMPKMIAFYEDTLGLSLVLETQTRDWAEFEAGGASLALHAIPAEIADTIEISEPPQPRSQTPIKVVFRVKDVVAERERLLERGALMFPMRPWGGCDGMDPEGNVFHLASG